MPMKQEAPPGDQQLADWLALAEKATSAPWSAEVDGSIIWINDVPRDVGVIAALDNGKQSTHSLGQDLDNFTFIAAAREGWPATIRALQAERRQAVEFARLITEAWDVGVGKAWREAAKAALEATSGTE